MPGGSDLAMLEANHPRQGGTMFKALSTLAANHADHYYGPPPWWPIFPVFWLLVIITLFVLFARSRRRWGGCGYGGRRGGLDHLAKRFAAGEIDETEYRDRRAVLEEQFEHRRR
jgi:putative membrane protein